MNKIKKIGKVLQIVAIAIMSVLIDLALTVVGVTLLGVAAMILLPIISVIGTVSLVKLKLKGI